MSTLCTLPKLNTEERMPLGMRYPLMNFEDYAVLQEKMSLAFVASELRKLYCRICGMEHENFAVRENGQPCGYSTIAYSLTCPHSNANSIMRMGYEASDCLGKTREGYEIYSQFRSIKTRLDSVDSQLRSAFRMIQDPNIAPKPLYHIEQNGLQPERFSVDDDIYEAARRFQERNGAEQLLCRDALLQLLQGD